MQHQGPRRGRLQELPWGPTFRAGSVVYGRPIGAPLLHLPRLLEKGGGGEVLFAGIVGMDSSIAVVSGCGRGGRSLVQEGLL